MNNKIDFIGAPINLGCDKDGVENTPDYIRQKWLRSHPAIKDLGNIECPKRQEILEEKYRSNPNIKFFTQILDFSSSLADKVKNSIINSHFPLIVGGDHVLSFGSIAGISLALGFDKFAVIYIDAHGDFNTEKTSLSANMHGMHLAFLMGYGEERAANFWGKPEILKPQNLYFIGARALDEGEKQLAKELNLKIVSSEETIREDTQSILKPILDDIKHKGIKHIHISFDIDVIDPVYAPGTGVKEKNGITEHKAVEIIKTIINTGLVRSVDIVELNTALDKEKKTEKVILNILDLFV